MTRSRLKSKANKSRKEEYMKAYKKQKVTRKFLKRRSCYPSIMKIIEKTTNETFSFLHVLPWETHQAVLVIKINKSTSAPVPTKVLWVLAKDTCIPLTDSINNSSSNDQFPSELKMADGIAIFKKDIPFHIANYLPVNLLPSLLKVYQKIVHQQLKPLFEEKLSPSTFWLPFKVHMHLWNLINKRQGARIYLE